MTALEIMKPLLNRGHTAIFITSRLMTAQGKLIEEKQLEDATLYQLWRDSDGLITAYFIKD